MALDLYNSTWRRKVDERAMTQTEGQLIWKVVDSLLPGDICMETIKLSKEQPPVIKMGETLDSEKIEILKKSNVRYLWVKIPPVIPPVIESQKIDKIKEDIKDIFKTAGEKMTINKKNIENLSQEIVNNVVKNFSDKISLIFLIQENDEEYTYVHEVHVGIISSLVAMEMGLKISDIARLTFSAIIHDVGKIMVPKDILYAPRRLTQNEFEVVKRHVEFGERICKLSKVEDEFVLSGVRDHHEKLDGTGYLRGLKSDSISLPARIIAAADIYDALISNRSYKAPWSPYKAISELIRMASVGKIDKKVLSAFISIMGLYPIGTTVLLSNNEKAVVVANTKNHITRPVVRLQDGSVVDTSKEKDLRVIQVLD